MPQTVDLRPEPLTAAAFAPFGDVIEIAAGASPRVINEGTAERFEGLARLQGEPGVSFTLAVMRAQPRRLPMPLRLLERHRQASQAFVPWSGGAYLVVVAPAGDRPSATTIRCFRATGRQGVNYRPGTWHHPLLALDTVSEFLVADQAGPAGAADCEEIVIDHLGVVIRTADV
jgi:ureidoglycolate lyase